MSVVWLIFLAYLHSKILGTISHMTVMTANFVTNRKTDVATNFIKDENGLPYVEATK